MERIEELLREELRRTEATGAAPADVMLARVARARRRRTTLVGAVAGVAVVAAGAALIGPLDAGGRAPAGAEPEPPPLYRNEVMRVVFTSATHGYVLQRRCATTVREGAAVDGAQAPPTVRHCGAALWTTADGGRGWRLRPLPTDPGTPDGYRDPSGRSLAFWSEDRGTIAVAAPDNRYWTSDDGGRTWTEAGDRRDEGPAGSVGVVGPDERQVFLTPPDTAALTGRDGANPVVAATDGSFWRTATGRPGALVTRDRGVTWQATTGTDAELDWVATYDGRTVYASSGAALLRSTDMGVTWTEVARRDSYDRSAAGVVLPDGDLVLAESRTGRLYRLDAGGTSLRPLAGAPANPVHLYRSGGWLVASAGQEERQDPDLRSIVSVSSDGGTTWYAVPPPGRP